MNRFKGFYILRISFFALLISLTGCVTPEPVASNAHLEQYRVVYLMKSKHDPRNVAPRIAERLRKTGFQVTEVFQDDTPSGQMTAVKTARDLAAASGSDQPAVLCDFGYLTLYTETDIRTYDFESLKILFYDLKTGKLVFKTAKYNYDMTVPENLELNRRFAQISDAFFPGKPNPF